MNTKTEEPVLLKFRVMGRPDETLVINGLRTPVGSEIQLLPEQAEFYLREGVIEAAGVPMTAPAPKGRQTEKAAE